MGPAKLSENTKINRRLPTLADDFYFAAPGTGTGGVSVLSNLLSLLANTAPIGTFADITAMLAGATPIKYFSYVIDATDDPAVGSAIGALYMRLGSDPTILSDYVLVFSGISKRSAFSDWDASVDAMPQDVDAVGSGPAGAILRGDQVIFTAIFPDGGNDWPIGTIGIAKQNNPTATSHWRLY